MKTKQVIIWRNDLKTRKGKMMAQACHASLGVILGLGEHYDKYSNETKEAIKDWCDNTFTKIVVYVNSEQELLDIYAQAQEANLPTVLITDNGLTEFKGVKTNTCCAIGPARSEEIDLITGKLNLM